MRWDRWLLAAFLLPLSVAAETVVIKGSNTFGEELGPRLIDEFQHKFTGIKVELESKGTASGLAALLAGECDIGAASRVANEDELRLARSRRIRLHSYLIGYYGVAVIVNESSPARNLTNAQVRDIFTGTISNWKDAGGEDTPIQTYIRDPVSGTYLGFQELAMERKPYVESAKSFRSYAEIARAVAADPQGIGYVGMNATQFAGVHAVTINGIVASVLSINEGMYPYARALLLYTIHPKEKPATRQFLRFVLSRDGQKLLEELGNARRYERSPFARTAPW